MSNFIIESIKTDSALNLIFKGTFNEDVKLDPTIFSGITNVNIDLDKVTSINSCGIREWLKWIKTSNKVQIGLHNCPKPIVDQFNMISGFLTNNTQVKSFYVPYYSEQTDEEKKVLYKEGIEYSKDQLNHPQVSDTKGSKMILDVVPEKYFKFLRKD